MAGLDYSLKQFDPITVKGVTYGSHQFLEYIARRPRRTCAVMVRVLHSSNGDFRFAMVREVRLIDVRAVKATTPTPGEAK